LCHRRWPSRCGSARRRQQLNESETNTQRCLGVDAGAQGPIDVANIKDDDTAMGLFLSESISILEDGFRRTFGGGLELAFFFCILGGKLRLSRRRGPPFCSWDGRAASLMNEISSHFSFRYFYCFANPIRPCLLDRQMVSLVYPLIVVILGIFLGRPRTLSAPSPSFRWFRMAIPITVRAPVSVPIIPLSVPVISRSIIAARILCNRNQILVLVRVPLRPPVLLRAPVHGLVDKRIRRPGRTSPRGPLVLIFAAVDVLGSFPVMLPRRRRRRRRGRDERHFPLSFRLSPWS